MGRSRFPGKPLKFQNRKRVSVLSGTVYNETASESLPPVRGGAVNDFAEDKEVTHIYYDFVRFATILVHKTISLHTEMLCLRNNYYQD